MNKKQKLALLSVYDKTGIEEFAAQLVGLGYDLLSTGNTAKVLKKKKIPVQEVSEYTGSPEIFGGRVKTLHPKIHAGILARDAEEDLKTLQEMGAALVDLVVINLYPFEKSPGIENIDIGGPTMLRAAAKNFARVMAVVDPADYPFVIEGLKTGKDLSSFRRELAAKAFQRSADYEAAIALYFGEESGAEEAPVKKLRYGENPHQEAAFYASPENEPLWKPPIQGKELSYNNIVDADAAWWLMRELKEESFACVIIKHTNPCGAALSEKTAADAFEKAFACDNASAFGGIVIFNREVDEAAAEVMNRVFFEIIMAPAFSEKALAIFGKKKNLRLLVTQDVHPPQESVRSAGGGQLVQRTDMIREVSSAWAVKTKRAPTEEEMRALAFSWKIAKHVKSNAIVFGRADRVVGVGAGQTSRVDAVKVAIMKAGSDLKGTVVASDAFFPFADNIEALAGAGATAVIQPGGSIRDTEVIEAADKYRLAMLFTGIRHFLH